MRKHRHQREKDAEIGFQIAPMIDVVFVIMLFFMVLAGNRKVETQMPMTLPSEETPIDSDVTPMEEQVFVDADGEILHNDSPTSRPELKLNFTRIAQQAKSEGGTPVVVTVAADPETQWEKVSDVLNAMTAAKITNVTFSVADE